ncbi:MAG: hypothetical protein CMA59_01020, partial [Euryarchaeota archaeon]|nr:hypothetical protein [Euryarchaeota archaeon]
SKASGQEELQYMAYATCVRKGLERRRRKKEFTCEHSPHRVRENDDGRRTQAGTNARFTKP